MPWFKGIYCQRAKHLVFRDSDPSRDKNCYGEPRNPLEVSIVKISECRTYEKDGRKYYDPKDAPAIPTNNWGSWYGYGKTGIRHQGAWFWVSNENKREKVWFHKYYTTPFYAVKDGIVYQGTIRSWSPPIQYYLEQGLEYKEARKKQEEFQSEILSKCFE